MMKRGMLAGVALMGALWCGTVAAALPAVKPEHAAALERLIDADFLKKGAAVPRVLVFHRCEGYVHGEAIVTANAAFRLAAERTGAFTVDFSEDYEALTEENLRKYDVLVMNNTTHLKVKEHPFLEQSLPAFVAAGKGYVALHAGVDTFFDHPALQEITNGLFAGHPWGAGGTWSFKLTDAQHPINAPFAETPRFKASDEIYQHRAPAFDPKKIQALVVLDFDDPEVAKRDGKVRPDSTFYPVTWIKSYGKGRVFYTSFGHDGRAWTNPKLLRHMFNGFVYAVGP